MSVILALDLAVRTGFAIGAAGSGPYSGSVTLKQKGELRKVALSNLIHWLDAKLRHEQPALVVKEAALPLQAYRDRANSEARIRMDYGLHGVVEGMCARFGINLEEAHPATIRKHFIGTGRMGERDLTKGAVINRCHLLGWFPRDCVDDNRADACAVWDWAAATFFRSPAKTLHLFGEAAE